MSEHELFERLMKPPELVPEVSKTLPPQPEKPKYGYFDLVEVPSGHIPAPWVEKRWGKLDIPLSDKVRDNHFFSCPRCGDTSFYSPKPLCRQCMEMLGEVLQADPTTQNAINWLIDIYWLFDDFRKRLICKDVSLEHLPDLIRDGRVKYIVARKGHKLSEFMTPQ